MVFWQVQVEPLSSSSAKYQGTIHTFRKIVAEEGALVAHSALISLIGSAFSGALEGKSECRASLGVLCWGSVRDLWVSQEFD